MNVRPHVMEKPIDVQTLRTADADPQLMHIVFEGFRTGAMLFSRRLELLHYKPGTPSNDQFNIIQHQWREIPWIILQIPSANLPIAELVAAETGVRLAHAIPHCIDREGVHQFVLRSSRVYKLEGRGLDRTAGMKMVYELESEYQKWRAAQTQFWYNGRWWYRMSPGQKRTDVSQGTQTWFYKDERGVEWYTHFAPLMEEMP